MLRVAYTQTIKLLLPLKFGLQSNETAAVLLPLPALVHMHVQEKTQRGVNEYLPHLRDAPAVITHPLRHAKVGWTVDLLASRLANSLSPLVLRAAVMLLFGALSLRLARLFSFLKYLSAMSGRAVPPAFRLAPSLCCNLHTLIYREHTSCFVLAFQPRLPLPSLSPSTHLLQCTSK